MEFVESVATAVDKKQHTVGVFIDLQKAFDTIDHSLLLIKWSWNRTSLWNKVFGSDYWS